MEEESEQSSDDYDETEPQIDSKNPEERKLARTLRIQRRLEALKRQKAAAENANLIDVQEKKNAIEIQEEKSLALLEILSIEGNEYVTNIRVANDEREVARRNKEGVNREEIFNKLKEEAEAAEDAFNEIADKWLGILKYNDPLHINEDILKQKEKCDELLKQKDGIIAMLKDEIKNAEINFNKDQMKQMNDVDSLAQRIEKQISLMRKAYLQELDVVEDVIATERRNLLDVNGKKWEDLYKKCGQEESNNARDREEGVENYLQEMSKIRRNFQEDYRASKISLENDIAQLQREFEQIKQLTLMNSEKLDYNYQILRKREDENLIIKSQQKRKLNKLMDQIQTTRKQIREYVKDTLTKIVKLRAEVNKLHKYILDIEKKSDRFANLDDKKFNQIWDLNTSKANELVEKILTIDRLIHEQQLGMEWIKLPIFENLGNKDELPSYKNALKQLHQQIKTKEEIEIEEELKQFMNNQIEEESNTYKDTLKRIMENICDKTDFLIEDQLNSILEPYTKEDNNLIKINNVFTALGMQQKEDIDCLMDFLFPYAYCEMCAEQGEDEDLMINIYNLGDDDEVPDIDECLGYRSMKSDSSSHLSIISESPIQLLEDLNGECGGLHVSNEKIEVEKQVQIIQTKQNEEMKRMRCKNNHPLVISSIYILQALREFMENFRTEVPIIPTMSVRLAFKRSTITRLLDMEDIKIFWKKYEDFFTKDHEEVWNGLLEGLKKYHELLKERKVLSEEVVGFRTQNEELRRLLMNYVKSDI